MTRVLFIGSKQLGLECLRKVHELTPSQLAGVLTFDDRKDSRSVLDGFQAFAGSHACPLWVAENRRDSERLIGQVRPDFCLVVGWYWIISQNTLAKVPRGFVGLHNSLLPKYRGAVPLVWAMINGDAEVGFSLFSFTAATDQGDIWGQRSWPVGKDDYISDVLARLRAEAISLLDELWAPMLENQVVPTPQDHSQATFCGVRTAKDGKIDWQHSAGDLYNFIRAQSDPYPGAFTHLPDGRQLTIWRAHPINAAFPGAPGQIAWVGDDGVCIACGDNRPLLVEQVGLKDSSKLPATQLLNTLGTQLAR